MTMSNQAAACPPWKSGFAHLGAMLLFVAIVSAAVGWSAPVQAHKGHGGPLVSFLKKKEVLRSMLPSGAKIVKRKQRLGDDAAAWAEKNFGVDLDESLYTYYLAKDRASGAIIGGAMIRKASYRHGDLAVAVGLDKDGKVTKVALTALSEKYIPEFEGTVGTGYIDGYEGLTLQELLDKTQMLREADKPSRVFATRLRDTAVLLSAFMHNAK